MTTQRKLCICCNHRTRTLEGTFPLICHCDLDPDQLPLLATQHTCKYYQPTQQ